MHQVPTSIRNAELVQQRHRQIAETARVVFRDKGFKDARVEDIAAALGIDKATLYQYITRKEDLLYIVFQHFVPLATRRLEHAARWASDPRHRLERLISEQAKIVADMPDLVLLTYRELRHLHRDTVESVLDLIRANHAPIETAIREAVEAGVLRPVEPVIAAHALLSMIYMWAPQAWDLERFGLEPVVDEVQRLFFDGAAAPRLDPGDATQ
jgi:AcrR family transcriptional regulator